MENSWRISGTAGEIKVFRFLDEFGIWGATQVFSFWGAGERSVRDLSNPFGVFLVYQATSSTQFDIFIMGEQKRPSL
jgi:hypothetical protein